MRHRTNLATSGLRVVSGTTQVVLGCSNLSSLAHYNARAPRQVVRMRTAIVIGGSIGGLLAGLVLAEVCDHVLLIERGELPDTPIPRAGVPQALHAHGLLAGGLRALEQLLPGLCRELAQRGCPSGDTLRDAAWIFSGRRLAVCESGVEGMTVARPLLEHAIRARVARLPNLHIRTGTRATGLLYEAGRVRGLRVVSATA